MSHKRTYSLHVFLALIVLVVIMTTMFVPALAQDRPTAEPAPTLTFVYNPPSTFVFEPGQVLTLEPNPASRYVYNPPSTFVFEPGQVLTLEPRPDVTYVYATQVTPVFDPRQPAPYATPTPPFKLTLP